MKNINNNLINLSFKILSILVFGLMFMPFNKAAAAPTYVPGHYNADGSYTYGDFVWDNLASTNGINNNPVPVISSINPKSGNIDANTKTITITGKNFIPGSIARVNDSTRPVTFIDPSHLLIQINSNDVYTYQNNGGFFITVFNGAPGGGYSNAIFFTVKNADGSATNTNQTDNTINSDTDKNYSNLASNAIFGSNSILPSGLVQWIILAIIILIIVILVRKIFGAEKNYHEAPMKHA